MINNFIKVILAVTSLSFSAAAMSQSLSEDEYRSLKKDIASDFQADLAYCTSYVGKEKSIANVLQPVKPNSPWRRWMQATST
ncbi:MAG: hypothetical protein PHI29_03265 [Gallionella sp.]|nr:hypothetical protein [Gallionella sp.]